MEPLELQKYLRFPGKSPETLKAELGIDFSTYENLVIFNYNQIDSPKTHPIVMECRGIILERDSWGIISYVMKRFFNDFEVQEFSSTFDFSNATALEKLDGSLISVFNYKGRWLMATRGVIENSTLVGFSNINFRDLFYATTQQYSNFWAKIDKNYCYCFELTSPENRIVTVYTERRLHLLTMRSVASWEEVTPEGLLGNAELLGVSLPSRTVFNGDRDSLLELAKKLATLQEGFVAVDYTKKDSDGISFKRLKIKNPSYVAIHHLKNRAGRSLRSLASLVYDCQTDEFLGYFQEFKPFIDSVQKSYDEYRVSIQQEVESLQEFFNQNRTAETRKAFALKVCKSKNAAFLFQLYDGRVKSLSEFLNMLEKTKTRKYLEKYLVEQLKLKDQNIYSVEE